MKAHVSVDDRSVVEGGSVTLTVMLSSPSREPVTVAHATTDASARSPADFTGTSGSLRFTPGDTSEQVTVRTAEDSLAEPDERFALVLSNAGNAVIADARGTATIVDDDPAPPATAATDAVARRRQESRRRGLRSCLRRAGRHTRREVRRARGLSGAGRLRARRHAKRHRIRLRRACLRRFGRTPGPVTGLRASEVSARRVVLVFAAAGTDGGSGPAVRSYLVKQSRRPIHTARRFRRAVALCRGTCRFSGVAAVGATLSVAVTGLRPGTTYHYAVAARDNVSRRLGPRSRSVAVRTSPESGP